MKSASKSERKRRAVAHRHTETRAVAATANEAVFAQMADRAEQQFFANRGFSAESIKALTSHGLELPEELLLMTERQILNIPGLGSHGLAEVRAYRRRFHKADK